MLSYVGPITSDPLDILYHYCRGDMAFWVNGDSGEVAWVRASHRGVQRLDAIKFPRKEKRYIFSPKFEIRYDTAFETVLRRCADLRREGKTFLTEPLVEGLLELHKMGFAHSYEAWQDGQLVGGAFGMQMGAMLTCDSMFHSVSNASKAAYGQTLVHMRERGFQLMDTNVVSRHHVQYGEQWAPQWEFEQMLRGCLAQSPTLVDGATAPMLPWKIKCKLMAERVGHAVKRRMGRHATEGVHEPAGEPVVV